MTDPSERTTVVSVDVVLDAPADKVWATVTDWERQQDWMVATTMRVVGDRVEGMGTRVEATTGVGPAALVDPMVVTEWEPPHRCVLRHTGTVVRGHGIFEVFALPGGRSRFVWREEIVLPLGPGGAARLAGGSAGGRGRDEYVPAPADPAARRSGAVTDPVAPPGTVLGSDGLARCAWAASAPEYVAYHDDEWGRRLEGDDAMFERLTLEAFQSGLSWLTILRKRPAFRAAFAGFSIPAVAAFGAADEARLLADAGIVRNRAKVAAALTNARAALGLPDGLSALLWSYAPTARRPAPATLADVPATAPESVAMARGLKSRGFVFVGPTTAYALMQATGMVDDHVAGCHARGGGVSPGRSGRSRRSGPPPGATGQPTR